MFWFNPFRKLLNPSLVSRAFRRHPARRQRPWQPACERLEDRCLLTTLGDLLLPAVTNPSPNVGDFFGNSVAAVGNNILVSAPGDNAGASGSGAAYLFDGTTGLLLRTFLNPTPFANDLFGNSVAAVGNNILVGAFQDDARNTDSGAVYLFDGTTFDLPNGNGPNDMVLRRNGTNLELFDNNSGVVIQTQLQPANFGAVIIGGAEDKDDTLTIDLTSLSLNNHVEFNGGAA